MNPESRFLYRQPGYQAVVYTLPRNDWVNWVRTPAEVAKQPSVAEAAAYLEMQAAIEKARRRTL